MFQKKEEKISRRSFFTKTDGAVAGTAVASLVISTIFNIILRRWIWFAPIGGSKNHPSGV